MRAAIATARDYLGSALITAGALVLTPAGRVAFVETIVDNDRRVTR